MAVGSYPTSSANKKTELYKYDTDAWTTVDDYPFCDGTGMGYFDMVYVSEMLSYFVIGGSCVDTSKSQRIMRQIAMFKDGAWSEAGQLNSCERTVSF